MRLGYALRNLVIGLVIVAVFLAWSEGGPAAQDFGRTVGRLAADVVGAIVEFASGLGEDG